MPRTPPLSRRLSAAALWPFGISLTSWNYMWRTTPLHRRELAGALPKDAPPPIAAGVSREDLQGLEDGVGPLFHRRYRTRIRDALSVTPEHLISQIGADLNRLAPTEFARFHKLSGDDELRPGDEYVVHMPGPWNGPVRVVDVTPTSFSFATLRGHLEAGQIEFRAAREEELILSIESWARSSDRLSDLLYQHLRMAKEVQLHMWISFLERGVRLSGGRMTGGLDIETHRVAFDDAA